MRKLRTRYAKTGARNLGSQQNQHKTNLAKMRKNKTTDIEENAPNRFRRDGGTEPAILTKSEQIQSSEVEKNKKTDTRENS